MSNRTFQVCLLRTTNARKFRISDYSFHVHKRIQLNNTFLQCIALSSRKLTKISANSNNVHFSGVRFICSHCLTIKSVLASLWPIITRCRLQINLSPSK